MRLYIKQKVFSIGDKYDVYDEYGNVYFNVKSEVFTIGDKIHLYNLQGQELFFIRRRITLFCARYEIYSGQQLCAEIQQELKFFRSKLNIQSAYGNYTIEGDLWARSFNIYRNGFLVGGVAKKFLSWSDTYEMNIADNEDCAFFAALVIAIDNCLHNDKN